MSTDRTRSPALRQAIPASSHAGEPPSAARDAGRLTGRSRLRRVGLLLAGLLWLPLVAHAVDARGLSPSTVTLASSANPSPFGESLTLTVQVTSPDPSVFSGMVTLYDGATAIASNVQVSGDGRIVLSFSNLALGPHVLKAAYAGDATHAPAESVPLAQVISGAGSRTELRAGPNPSVDGQGVELTARVFPLFAGAPLPTGSVSFLDGTTPIGSAPLDDTARAQVDVSTLAVGAHEIVAVYSGDAFYGQSTSQPVAQAVGAGGIEVAVALGTAAPPACDGSPELATETGTLVNYCFTVTNRTARALRYHSLNMSDLYQPPNFLGDPFLNVLFEREIPPGGSARYHQIYAAGTSNDLSFTWTAQRELPAYRIEDDVPFDYVDISAQAVSLGAVNGYPVPLPFPFTLYGRTYAAQGSDIACLYNTGIVQLSPYPNGCWDYEFLYGYRFPPNPDSRDALAPWWDTFGSAGDIRYAVVGQAPARRFVIEWRNRNHANQEYDDTYACTVAAEDCGVTFQLILDEATGVVTYSYLDVEFDVPAEHAPEVERGASAAVMLIGYDAPATYQSYSVGTPTLAAGRSVRWTPVFQPHVAEVASRLRVGRPRLSATPSAIDATAAPGEPLVRRIDIGNSGDLPLRWSLDAAGAQAHFPSLVRSIAPVGGSHRAPVATHASDVSSTGNAGPPRTSAAAASVYGVPAYGFKQEALWGSYMLAFDATRPRDFVKIGHGINVYAGDFVDNDFSRQYAISDNCAVDGCFGTFDTATGLFTPIASVEITGPNGIEQRWSGLSWDASTRTLYGVSTTCLDPESTTRKSYLHRIDPASGSRTRIAEIALGSPNCIADIAVAPDGLMYGLDSDSDALVAIDKDTGAAAPIGSIGFATAGRQGMDFDDGTGVLYLSGNADTWPQLAGMYTVDLHTGAAAFLGQFDYSGSLMQMTGFSIARPGGACARPGEVPWLFFEAGAGTTAPGGTASRRVVLDPAGLAAGTHSAAVCIASNDPARALLRIPVELTVRDDDTLFADGFESGR